MQNLPFRQAGRFYRGNLHAHSSVSDGALSPDELIDTYRKNGYDFIAVTDHFRERFGFPITDTRGHRCDSFTTILGAELHAPALGNGEDWHILAVGLPLDFPATGPDEDAPSLGSSGTRGRRPHQPRPSALVQPDHRRRPVDPVSPRG